MSKNLRSFIFINFAREICRAFFFLVEIKRENYYCQLTDEDRDEFLRSHFVLRYGDDLPNFYKKFDSCWRRRLEKFRAVFKLSHN